MLWYSLPYMLPDNQKLRKHSLTQAMRRGLRRVLQACMQHAEMHSCDFTPAAAA